MTTEFGKVLRKIRVDLDLTLAALAAKIGASAAYLSALETGRKPVPPMFANKVAEALELGEDQQKELAEAAAHTRQKSVLIPLEGKDQFSRQLAVAFARRMEENMSNKDVQELMQLLETGHRKRR